VWWIDKVFYSGLIQIEKINLHLLISIIYLVFFTRLIFNFLLWSVISMSISKRVTTLNCLKIWSGREMDGGWSNFQQLPIWYGPNFIEEGYSRRGYIKDRDPKMSKREIKVWKFKQERK